MHIDRELYMYWLRLQAKQSEANVTFKITPQDKVQRDTGRIIGRVGTFATTLAGTAYSHMISSMKDTNSPIILIHTHKYLGREPELKFGFSTLATASLLGSRPILQVGRRLRL